MPNTFLNTGRTVAATSNPINNVNQVSNNPVNQVQANQTTSVQNTQSTAQNQQTNSAINPITIPIQIQPQIATTGVSTTTGNNNIQALQTNNQQQSRTNAAPTPQTYNSNNTNNNVIDFNQIYSSYQSQYGNNNQSTNNTGTSGIKKTSLGTTIVTPTTSNLNSIQGQYQSAYADSINGLISEVLSRVENGFDYDPANDAALQMAAEYAANTTMENMISSGILNSSMTAERVARVVSELIPQYEQLAYTRWTDSLSQLASTAQLVMNYDSQQFEYWKDAKDREFQNKQFEYQKQQDELENAWKRVDELGYVDNEAAAILGVPAGTLSGEARLAKEQQEFELQKMREQAQIEYENNKALYELRTELDKEYANYEYQLANKYEDVNYSKYEDVIKNAYAIYDDTTGQYVVPDEDTHKELQQYLDGLYDSGQLSESEFLRLTAKYAKYNNSTTNSTPGLTVENYETWIKALDGNNSALEELRVTIYGQTMSHVNNSDARNAVYKALEDIETGKYIFTTNQQLMNDLKEGKFGKIGWGL